MRPRPLAGASCACTPPGKSRTSKYFSERHNPQPLAASMSFSALRWFVWPRGPLPPAGADTVADNDISPLGCSSISAAEVQ